MPLGDGERQFFEQGFFDIFRGKEGKAEAASDRAEHFRDKAERLDAKSERLSPQLAAAREEEDVEIDTPRGRARTRMRIPQIQALKAALEEQNKVNQEQAEALKAASDALAELRADHEKLQAGVLKAMRAIRQRMKRKDDDFKFLSEALLAGVNGLIEVVNVSDTVQQPMAKAGAAVLTNLAAADRIKDNNQEKMLMAGAVLLNAIAYYDAAEGVPVCSELVSYGLPVHAGRGGRRRLGRIAVRRGLVMRRWVMIRDVRAEVAVRATDRILAVSVELDPTALHTRGIVPDQVPDVAVSIGNPEGKLYGGKWASTKLRHIKGSLSYVGFVEVPQSVTVEGLTVHAAVQSAVSLVPSDRFFAKVIAVPMPPDPDRSSAPASS